MAIGAAKKGIAGLIVGAIGGAIVAGPYSAGVGAFIFGLAVPSA